MSILRFQYATFKASHYGRGGSRKTDGEGARTRKQRYIIVSIIVPQTAQNVNIYNIFNLLLLFEVYKWQKLCYNR